MASAQPGHGWSCLVSPAFIPLPSTSSCVQQSLSKASLRSLFDKISSPLALLGCVLTQGYELLLAWLGDLGKNMQEQFSLDVLHTFLILGTVYPPCLQASQDGECGCVQPAGWHGAAPVRVSIVHLAAVLSEKLAGRPSLHRRERTGLVISSCQGAAAAFCRTAQERGEGTA